METFFLVPHPPLPLSQRLYPGCRLSSTTTIVRSQNIELYLDLRHIKDAGLCMANVKVGRFFACPFNVKIIRGGKIILIFDQHLPLPVFRIQEVL
jgi:hypothetical protein